MDSVKMFHLQSSRTTFSRNALAWMAVLALKHPATVKSSTPILAKDCSGSWMPIGVLSEVSPEKISSYERKKSGFWVIMNWKPLFKNCKWKDLKIIFLITSKIKTCQPKKLFKIKHYQDYLTNDLSGNKVSNNILKQFKTTRIRSNCQTFYFQTIKRRSNIAYFIKNCQTCT